MKFDVYFQIRNQETSGVAQKIAGQMHLLKRLGIHEVEVLAVVVQILHFMLFQLRFLYLIFGRKTVLHHGAGRQLAHFHLHKTAQVAGGAVLHFEDGIKLVIPLDHHAGAYLCCGNHKRELPVYQDAWPN